MKAKQSGSRPELEGSLEGAKRCHSCGADAVVPVKDEKFDKIHKKGNPYRHVCLACDKHVRMCSREYWKQHPDRFLLKEGADEPTPVFNCPECTEEVRGRANRCPHCGVTYEW